jgi:hypothetical protein
MSRLSFAVRVLLLACALGGCGGSERDESAPPDADGDLESIVRDIVGAIGERDTALVLRHLALEFRGGPEGREPDLDHADAVAIVLEFLQREHAISARLEDARVHAPVADGSRRVEARVWLDASDVLRDPASAIPASAVRYRFDVRFARREGTWQAVAASYARVEPTG